MTGPPLIEGVGEEVLLWLDQGLSEGLLRPVDRALSAYLANLAKEAAPLTRSVLAVAGAVLSAASRDGHTLLDLGPSSSSPYLERLPDSLPPPLSWSRILKGVVGSPERPGPVLLDREALYLMRFYRAEIRVAEAVGRRLLLDQERLSGRTGEAISPEALGALDQYFPLERGIDDPVNAGRLAAIASLWRSFLVITGGPGTGKTWTAARILALHRALSPHARIVATAPTGKASARMGEALSTAGIPGEPPLAMTLHRLLEAGRRGFGRSRENPLDWELVLVDELSMIDLPLMDRLLEALPNGSKLILTGDRDQLASVGAGSVMSDLCGTLLENSSFSGGEGGLTVLSHNFRQSEFPALRTFARAVAVGDQKRAMEILSRGEGGLSFLPAKDDSPLPSALLEEGWGPLSLQSSREDALLRLDAFMALTPLREGPFGSLEINRQFHARMRRQGGGDPGTAPILVLENSYETGLMNGDLGILSSHTQSFRKGGAILSLPERLSPEWEFSYAMTIHKSQGSEFDHVLLLLGAHDHPLLTRALLYTGATRARRRLTVWASGELLERAILRPVSRSSALGDRLASLLPSD